jgi:hypothetical protein
MRAFKFEVHQTLVDYCSCKYIENPVKTFQDEDVDKAFDAAYEWIRKAYKEDNGPDYCIVSEFGVIHI